MVVRMRHTRAHTRNRRSHHALTNPAIAMDGGVMHRRHHLNTTTGMYRGKQIIDVNKKAVKKAKKTKETK